MACVFDNGDTLLSIGVDFGVGTVSALSWE